jgi:hypothetical protein
MAVGVGRRPTGQAVAVACVDYDELRGTAQHRDARLGIAHRAAEGEPHRAEAEPVDLQVTAQKNSPPASAVVFTVLVLFVVLTDTGALRST